MLPMLRTSGPWPEVVAVRIRFSRSDQGTTSTLTLTPLCFSNLSSSGWRTFLSISMLAPWLDAQYVSVFGESLDPPPFDEPPPQAVAAVSREMVTAPAAAARILRMAAYVPFPEGARRVGSVHFSNDPHGLI